MPETRRRCKGAAARARRLVIGPGFTLIELLVVIEAGFQFIERGHGRALEFGHYRHCLPHSFGQPITSFALRPKA